MNSSHQVTKSPISSAASEEQRREARQVRDRPVEEMPRVVPAVRIERHPDARDRIEAESRADGGERASREHGGGAVPLLQHAAREKTQAQPRGGEQHEERGISHGPLEKVEARRRG